jgi:hypothetical protein
VRPVGLPMLNVGAVNSIVILVFIVVVFSCRTVSTVQIYNLVFFPTKFIFAFVII